MEVTELLARFKGFQKAVIALLAVLVVGNVVTLAWILSRIDRLNDRLPVSVRCSGFHGTLPPVDRVLSAAMEADMDLVSQGKAGAVASFRLVDKVPNSEVVLAYRVVGVTEWSTAPMSSGDDPLTFTASILFDSGDEGDQMEYRLEQRVKGEIVHASTTHSAPWGYLFGGNGDLYADYLPVTDSTQWNLILHSWYGNPKFETFQIAEVRLRIDKARPEEVTLNDDGYGVVRYTFSPDGLKVIEITVLYKDGQVRTATFDPSLPRDPGEPLVKR